MVNYRLAKIEDVEQIDALCKRENIATPFDGTTIVAEDDGKILGFINASQIAFVNGYPCISVSRSDRPGELVSEFEGMCL